MTVYFDWFPGSDQTGEYTSIADLLSKFLELAQAPIPDGSPGGGAPSGAWHLDLITPVGGAQPYWSVTFGVPAGHTYSARLRYWAGLIGTWDPSSVFAADTILPYGWSSGLPYTTVATWNARAAASGGSTGFFNTLQGALSVFPAGTSAFTFVVSRLNYTDGTRAGGQMAWLCAATYNPTPTEIAAGIFQLDSRRTGYVSDAADGTLNGVDGQATIGTSTSQIPVPTFQGGTAAQKWADWMGAVADGSQVQADATTQAAADLVVQLNTVFQSFQWQSNTYVTNEGDLGQPDHPAQEPTTPIVNVFARPNVVVDLHGGSGPSVFSAITTLPGKALAALEVAGSFILGLLGAGVATLLGNALAAAPAALELAAGTEVTLVGGAPAVVGFAVPAITAAATGVIVHEANSAIQTYEQRRSASAAERIATALEAGQAGGMSPEASQALVDIAASLSPGTELAPTFYDKLEDVRVMLQAVAETRQELTLRAKGIEVEAMTGSLTGG